jgi:fatty acid desaturase
MHPPPPCIDHPDHPLIPSPAPPQGDVTMTNSHLIWWSKRFRTPTQRAQARRSLLLLYAQVALLLFWAYCGGVTHVLLYYTVPYLVFSSWLVIVTFLHHNLDPRLEWTDDRGGWTWVRGQLVTIDRDYGSLGSLGLQSLTHHIGLHAAHHLFMGIPHYRLADATTHVRGVLGSRYVSSEERILPAFWRNWLTYRENIACPDDASSFRYPARRMSMHHQASVDERAVREAPVDGSQRSKLD